MDGIHSQPICRDISLLAGWVQHHNFSWGVWDSKSQRGCFNVFVLLYSWPSRARSALVGQGKRYQGCSPSLHPCRSPCCVPYPCNKEPCIVLFPREGQGGSCGSGLIVLGAGWAHGNRLPVLKHTVEGRGTTHKKVDLCDDSRKDHSFTVSRSCCPHLKGFMEWCWSFFGMCFPHGALCLCCCLMWAVGWGERESSNLVTYSRKWQYFPKWTKPCWT